MEKLLLEFNADKNTRGEEERTPLIIAARNNHGILVKMLIEAGCDVNSKDAHGKQAYHYTVDRGSRESFDIHWKSPTMDNLLDPDRGNEESWHFEIQNQEMYLKNGNMSSIMELYIPKGALPSGSSSVVKATIRQKCNENPGTPDQEGQFGPTMSLLPHGTKFARPILALVRLPYDDFVNAEEFEFIVLHSDTEVDAQEEWVNVKDNEKGETSGLVIPEQNVSMVALFHFSCLSWFRRRRTKQLQVLVTYSLEHEILTVTCYFCPAGSKNGKDCKGTVIFHPPLVITSEQSSIDVCIKEIGEAWKMLSMPNQQVSHNLVWRTKRFLELQFVFEMGDNPSRFVCTIEAQQKKGKSFCTVILPIDLLERNLDRFSEQAACDSSSISYDVATAADQPSQSAEASSNDRGLEMEADQPSQSAEASSNERGLEMEDDQSSNERGLEMEAGTEWTTEITLPEDFRQYLTENEIRSFHSKVNRPIPDTIRNTVNRNCHRLAESIRISPELLNHLQGKEVFTKGELEYIEALKGLEQAKARAMINMLLQTSFNGYLMFRGCLRAAYQGHVCHLLPCGDGSSSA